MPTLVNDFIAGLDTSVMAEVNGSQLMQQVQEAVVNLDRGILFATDTFPTVAEIAAHLDWRRYLLIKITDNPKIIYGFDAIKYAGNINPPWTPVAFFAGSVTNAMLAGGIQLSKLSINPPIPADAGKFVKVNGAGSGYIHDVFNLLDGSIPITKFSVSGGSPLYIIRIKADATGWEFVSPNNFISSLTDNVIDVSKLFANGVNLSSSKFPKVVTGTDIFTLDILRAADISAVGVPAGYHLTSNGVNGTWTPPNISAGEYFLLLDSKNQNVGAGAAPVASTSAVINWFQRELNLEAIDEAGIVTLSANQFTLAAGTYRVNIEVPGYQTDQQTARLYNITDAAEQSGTFVLNSYGQNNAGDHWIKIVGRFTIATAKVFRIDQAVKDISGGNALGIPKNIFGRSEVYTKVEGWRI